MFGCHFITLRVRGAMMKKIVISIGAARAARRSKLFFLIFFYATRVTSTVTLQHLRYLDKVKSFPNGYLEQQQLI